MRIVGNFLAASTGNLVGQAANFVTVVYLARTLGPFAYGQANWATATLAFGSNLADMGLQTLGIRMVAQNQDQAAQIVSEILSLKFILGIVSLIGIVLFAQVSGQSPAVRQLTIFFGTSLLISSLQMDWVFTGLQRMFVVGFGRVLQSICYALLVFALIQQEVDVLRLPVAQIVSILLSVVILGSIFLRRFGAFPKPRLSMWSSLLKQTLPLGISALIVQVYIGLPPLLLGLFKDETATGLYGGAYRLMQVPQQLLGLFFLTLYPVVAERWRQSPESVQPFLKRTLRLILIVTLPVAVGTWAVGPDLLNLVLGQRYAASALPFQILIWNLVFVGINGTYAQLVLLMGGRQKQFMQVVSVGAAVSAILDFALIPSFSYVGAAIAWAVAEVAVCIASFWFSRSHVQLDFWKSVWRPGFAACLMGIATWVLNSRGLPLGLTISAAMVVYGFGLVLLGELDAQEWEFAKSFLFRRTRPV